MQFWMVSRVGRGMGVLDRVHMPQEGEVWAFSAPLIWTAFWVYF